MKIRSAIVSRFYVPGRGGVPAVQTWVFWDGRKKVWRNARTNRIEQIISIEGEKDVSEKTTRSAAADAVTEGQGDKSGSDGIRCASDSTGTPSRHR
jgi:hypothetical protein